MSVNKELLQRVSNWINGKPANPFMVTLRITWKCNLRCRGCNIPDMQNKKFYEAPSSYFLKIVDEAAKLEVRRIEVVGEGEPLCKPDTLQIMQRIKHHNISGTMTSNCTLFTEGKIKSTIKMGFDLIAVSLDGPDAKTHDYIRGVEGTFDRVVRNLEMFKKYKKEMKKDNPKIILVPFLNRINYNRIEEMITIGKDLGVGAVNFKVLVINEKSKELNFTKEKLEELSTCAKRAYKTAKEIGMETNVETFINKDFLEKQTDIPEMLQLEKKQTGLFSITCFRPFYHMGVSPDGSFFICHGGSGEHFEEQKGKNTYDKSLTSAWYGAEAERLRTAMKNDEVPDICKICCGGFVLDDWALRSELCRVLEVRPTS